MLSKKAEEPGGTAHRFGLLNGCDLSCTMGRDVVAPYLGKHRPLHLGISVPGGTLVERLEDLSGSGWAILND